jgi:hypothetical protein
MRYINGSSCFELFGPGFCGDDKRNDSRNERMGWTMPATNQIQELFTDKQLEHSTSANAG